MMEIPCASSSRLMDTEEYSKALTSMSQFIFDWLISFRCYVFTKIVAKICSLDILSNTHSYCHVLRARVAEASIKSQTWRVIIVGWLSNQASWAEQSERACSVLKITFCYWLRRISGSHLNKFSLEFKRTFSFILCPWIVYCSIEWTFIFRKVRFDMIRWKLDHQSA